MGPSFFTDGQQGANSDRNPRHSGRMLLKTVFVAVRQVL